MKTPPLPPDEKERLEALRQLKILDTPREERFDRLVRLAARLLDVPITAISLVDEDRQWFKASEGLPVRETPRDVSFCGHNILEDGPLVVEDAEKDPRFHDNPLVTEDPSIRFYVGHPIQVGGQRIGSFCAIDRRPRRLTEEQIGLLGDLTALAERELQLDDINTLRERIERATLDKQRVEQEIERFFSLPLDLLCIIRPDGYFRRLSTAWTRVLGWSQAELLERPSLDFIHPEDRRATTDEVAQVAEGKTTIAFENRYRCRDGSFRWFMWNAIVSPGDGLIYAAARDISELKRMQALKDEFVSIVSHELRTPLTSIRGAVDLVATGVTGELPDEAASLIEVARSNCERLSLLINDILDIEKIAAGKLEFKMERHPIVELVERSLADNAQFASRRSVAFRLVETIPETKLRLDTVRLHQVLSNLLSNAAKFEPEGGTVEVAIRRMERSVRVSVTDHGEGIPEEFHDRIFEKFAQADASDRREKGGTGLGLSISKAIVERLGGRIDFTTEINQGSTFFFELPCPAEKSRQQDPTDRRPRILICEGDPLIAELLSVSLDEAGFATDVATSFRQARDFVARRRYRAATVDLVMPDGDGISLVRELRNNDTTQTLPIIVVSAEVNEARDGFNGGAVNVIDWLSKPVDRPRFLRAVRGAVESSASRRPRVLHVEDDPGILRVTTRLLDDIAEIVPAKTVADARQALEQSSFDLVVLDWSLPDGIASALLPMINDKAIPVMIFSAHDVPSQEVLDVADVLVKSQVGNDELRERILTLAGAREIVTV